MQNTSRPRVVRADQLADAARAGVALAIEERVKRFGPRAAIISPTIVDPFDPGTTTVGIIAEPEPFGTDPYMS